MTEKVVELYFQLQVGVIFQTYQPIERTTLDSHKHNTLINLISTYYLVVQNCKNKINIKHLVFSLVSLQLYFVINILLWNFFRIQLLTCCNIIILQHLWCPPITIIIFFPTTYIWRWLFQAKFSYRIQNVKKKKILILMY